MGRRRESNFDDPPRLHRKGKVWYHVSGTLPRIWTKLSSDRAEALRLWAQREGVREDGSTKLFSVVARRYVREVFPTKSVQTRRDNDKELANLLKVFGHMPVDAIAPVHVRQYMDIRGEARAGKENLWPVMKESIGGRIPASGGSMQRSPTAKEYVKALGLRSKRMPKPI